MTRFNTQLRFTSTSSPQRLQPTTIDRAMDSEQQQQKGMTSGESTPFRPILLCSMLMTFSDSRLLDGPKGDVQHLLPPPQ